jgi:transcriptional regulator with XRE-family HTH domain
VNTTLIRDRRKALKLAQYEVAHRLGVAPATYIRWERGEYEPRASDLVTLAGILGVEVNDLLTDPDPDPASEAPPAKAS